MTATFQIPGTEVDRFSQLEESSVETTHFSIFFSQLHSRPSRLPYHALVLPAGNAPESFESGEDRRFRLVTDEVTGPERSRPRVPLPPLRAVRAGRAHSPEANARKALSQKAKSIRAERDGRGQKSPAGRGGRATYLN